jgi:hypothetical protein
MEDVLSDAVTCQRCEGLKEQVQNKAEKYELLEEQEGEISKNLEDLKKNLESTEEEHKFLLVHALNKLLNVVFITFTIFF